MFLSALPGLAAAAEVPPLPETRRVEAADTLHGIRVPDPYRWLEAMQSEEVVEWSRAQDARARAWIEGLPHYAEIRSQMLGLADYPQIGDYVERGGRAFYLEGGPGRAQPVLVVEDEEGAPRILVDPSARGGQLAIGDYSVSPGGETVAVALVDGGSRFFDWIFIDVESGQQLADRLERAKIPIGPSTMRRPWSLDGESFFYTRYQHVDASDPLAQPTGLALFRHAMGTDPGQDALVYQRPDDPEVRFDGMVSDDGGYLVVHEWRGSANGDAIWVKALDDAESSFRPLVRGLGSRFWVLGSLGSRFFLATDLEAPRRRVVEVDLASPEREHWRERVPQAEDTLSQAFVFGDRLLLAYSRDARNLAEIWSLEGDREHRLELPDGLVWNYTQRYWSGFTGDRHSTRAHVRSLGPTSVGSIYRLDLESGALTLERRSGIDFDIEAIETEQIFYESAGGVRVPMFLVHRRDLDRARAHPTMLWVYGAYGWTAQPFVNAMFATWLERGGVLAMPNVRGGGAYGEEWRLAGSRANKPNTVRDTVAAAEWLIAAGWADETTLAVFGNSAGATAAGGALALRPELFAAGVFEVPVADLIRAEHFRGGPGWVDTFGSTADEEELRAMLSYSPYQSVSSEKCYPPVLVTAGDLDVTAVPMHAYKLAATLQHANATCPAGQSNPVLLRIDWGTDHGQNKPAGQLHEERAAELSFLFSALSSAGTGDPG